MVDLTRGCRHFGAGMAGPPYPGGVSTPPQRDRPWLMRTYAGHSSASASNELFRRNLAKGQTGLSVAFDLPTQTGYDPESPMGRSAVAFVPGYINRASVVPAGCACGFPILPKQLRPVRYNHIRDIRRRSH